MRTAVRGRCPRCGNGPLFAGPVAFAPACPACGLDFTRYNVGDGPAAFLTMLVGVVIVALALWVEFAFRPPFWVHVILWTPLTAGMVIWTLRIAKALLLALEHRSQAGEGRIAAAAEPDRGEDG